MGYDESLTSGAAAQGGLVRTRSGRLVPAGQALMNAAPKAPQKAHSKWTYVGVIGGLCVLFVGLAFLIASGNGRDSQTSSGIQSILKDVGHVIRSQKGIGIDR